ncbi:MAG: YggS family pyridoxal phosphate-dependent enzyme [Candidatus Micrarchaeota archaeon]
MESIAERLMAVEKRLASACAKSGRDFGDVRLVAVSKGRSFDEMREAYDAGIRWFGESRVQEAETKWPLMPAGAELHLVGHLQRNKARKAAEIFSLVHSVDSIDLAQKLNRSAEELQKRLKVLVQVNVSGEASKKGFSPKAAGAAVPEIAGFEWLELQGLMTIAPIVRDAELARPVFRKARELRDEIGKNAGLSLPELSMGMSQDYWIAVEEGSSMVRVGQAVFGEERRKTAAEKLEELETEA